ncbi:MAG TPA: hypothetical protein VGV13_11410 [Methylomirabilota bacterium]|jgi:hypothetical protein|nr:hypothetical protein [Methylomirabilota bacterium]
MNTLAHYALTGSIVASALGGLVLCGLIVKYGFLPPEDERIDVARRRIFVTRLGYTFAATCFAVTTLLTVVALSPRSGVADPARLADDLHALAARVSAIESLVRQINVSVEAMLLRVERSEPWLPASERPAR